MKKLICFCCFVYFTNLTAQVSLVNKLEDGRYTLSNEGASYFAKLSLQCVEKKSPHFYERFKEYYEIKDSTTSKDLWPSFYGCYDWHSSVHNHWALIKLLKNYPSIPEAAEIRERLNEAFSTENIKLEAYFLSQNEEGYFEFPYGQSWFLKLADELKSWDDPDTKKWLKQIDPILLVIEENHLKFWIDKSDVSISGSHDSPAMGISFALDYSRSFKKKKLEKILISTALKYYLNIENAPISSEPVEYDFMSGTLLIADLMRKVFSGKEYTSWLSKFSPELVDEKRVHIALKIKKTEVHDGQESHWDGYHLNRIWCLNGILKTFPEGTIDKNTKKEWVTAMNDMWDYAQESIGKGNYDIDHWLSSFSVFALIGY